MDDVNSSETPDQDPHSDQSLPAVLNIGSVLQRSVQILGRNALPFLLIALVWSAPTVALQASYLPGEEPFFRAAFLLLSITFDLIFGGLATAMIVYGTFSDLRGRRVGPGECLTRGVMTFGGAVGVAVVSALVITLGLIVLILPGVILSLMFAVAIPIALVERTGITKSLKRSVFLTSGNLIRLFAIIFLPALVALAVDLLLAFVFGFSSDDPLSSLSLVYDGLTFCLVLSIEAVIATVAYHDLRVAKEGIGINEIVAVFD